MWLYWSITHGPKNQVLERKIHGSEYAQIVAQQTDTRQVNQLGTPIILWTYGHDGAPIGLSETSVRESVANAIASYNELFKDDILLFTRFRFAWDNLGTAPPVIAQSVVLQFDLTYSFVRTSILNTYAASPQDADFFENGLYANIPTGSNIEYVAENGTTVQTSSVLTTVPLATKFAGIGSQKELLITLNADLHGTSPFDPDPSDGISGIDPTGILIHELGHHFGFGSNLEGILDFSSLTVWDIYRMGDALGTISPNEFFGQPRELRATEEANAALQINSSVWTLALSTGIAGDGRQAGHWKDDSLSGTYIGIMDPVHPDGSLTVDGRYLQSTDIRAFDVMGYDIDAGDFMPVQVPEIISPTSDVSLDPALPLQLEWNPQSGTTSSDILIYDLGTTIANSQRQGPNPPLVFRSDGISGGSLTVQTTELPLLQGHRYQWHAAVYHPMGVNLSDPSTFIAACLADFNGDVSAFLVAYGNQDPAADFFPDGLFNFTDVSLFLAAYGAGCP